MPASKRDQRHATAARFATVLNQSLQRHGMRQVDLVNASHGDLQSGSVARWCNADNPPAPRQAIMLARILGESSIEFLRAAGHGEIADDILAEAKRLAAQMPAGANGAAETPPRPADPRREQIEDSALPPAARAAAEEFLEHADASAAEGLARYIDLLRKGEKIVAGEPNGDNANAS